MILATVIGFSSAAAEPTEEERLADWYVFRDNIRNRTAELLSTNEQFKDGIGPDNIDLFITLYREIETEEGIASWLRLYPDLTEKDILTSKRASHLDSKYGRSNNTPDQTYYQDLWNTTVARLRKLADDGEMTVLWYEVMPFSNFRFANGETFHNYLKHTGKIGQGTSANETMLAYLDLLASCTVRDNGYLIYHAEDGNEQIVLAWYDTVLKHFNEDEFADTDLDSLPH